MLMYPALHKMQWFSRLDVFTLKIRRKLFDFNVQFYESK